jgi:hypothetical protein
MSNENQVTSRDFICTEGPTSVEARSAPHGLGLKAFSSFDQSERGGQKKPYVDGSNAFRNMTSPAFAFGTIGLCIIGFSVSDTFPEVAHHICFLIPI